MYSQRKPPAKLRLPKHTSPRWHGLNPFSFPASVIEVSSRNKKANGSWVIGRLIRDLENEVEKPMETWYDPPEHDGGKPIKSGEWDSGLLISIYEVRSIPPF